LKARTAVLEEVRDFSLITTSPSGVPSRFALER
jgi:hypothetical protein